MLDVLRSLKNENIYHNKVPVSLREREQCQPVEDPVVVEVPDRPQQLHHQALYLPGQKHLALLPHQLHERLEVVRDKVHHDEDLVHVGPHDDLSHGDDVGVLRDEQRVDLPQRRDGEALLLALHLEPLEGDDLLGLLVAGAVHHAVRALLYTIHALKKSTIDDVRSFEIMFVYTIHATKGELFWMGL